MVRLGSENPEKWREFGAASKSFWKSRDQEHEKTKGKGKK